MFLYKKAISSGRNKKTCLSCVKNTTVFVNFITTALMLLLPALALANNNCSKVFSEKNNSSKTNRFMPYSEAKDFARSLGIRTAKQLKKWASSGNRPSNFPANPERTYKEEWENWGAFFETGNVYNGGKKFMPYHEAKKFIQFVGIHSESDFRIWIKSENKPPNFPSNPSRTYKEEWENWGAFLGTGNVYNGSKKFMPYHEAKELVQSLGIRNAKQLKKWASSDNKPPNFPANPKRTYKEEWENWGAFLGTGNVYSDSKKFMSYDEAKGLVQSLGIHSELDFRTWIKSENKPPNFPANPKRTYKEEWENWGVFLGTGNVYNGNKKFMSYSEAKDFARSLKFRNKRQFHKWSKLGNRPHNFPADPRGAYKEKWEGYGIFLGTGNVYNGSKKFMSYNEAKKLIQSNGVRSVPELRNWSKLGKRPTNFPANPKETYQKEWESWNAFFGNKKSRFMGYYQAQKHIKPFGLKTKTDFIRWSKEGKRPPNIPANPNRYYTQHWTNWQNFLGYEKPPKYMKYRTAQNYLQKEGITTFPELMNFLKSDKRPPDFPDKPHIVYSEWKGAYAFLKIKWLSFKKATNIVRFSGLTSKEEYLQFIKTENMLDQLPADPESVYSAEWRGWDHFFFGGD